jgi:hypothetical protein
VYNEDESPLEINSGTADDEGSYNMSGHR